MNKNKFFKQKTTGRVHSWKEWVEIAERNISFLEINEMPYEYLARHIKKGNIIEVKPTNIETIKRANYQILKFAEYLAEALNITTQVEADETNATVMPWGQYPERTIKYFQDTLDKYKKKIYKKYEIE